MARVPNGTSTSIPLANGQTMRLMHFKMPDMLLENVEIDIHGKKCVIEYCHSKFGHKNIRINLIHKETGRLLVRVTSNCIIPLGDDRVQLNARIKDLDLEKLLQDQGIIGEVVNPELSIYPLLRKPKGF